MVVVLIVKKTHSPYHGQPVEGDPQPRWSQDSKAAGDSKAAAAEEEKVDSLAAEEDSLAAAAEKVDGLAAAVAVGEGSFPVAAVGRSENRLVAAMGSFAAAGG